jgi:hypothetical protein
VEFSFAPDLIGSREIAQVFLYLSSRTLFPKKSAPIWDRASALGAGGYANLASKRKKQEGEIKLAIRSGFSMSWIPIHVALTARRGSGEKNHLPDEWPMKAMP